MKQSNFQRMIAILLCVATITALLLCGCVKEVESKEANAEITTADSEKAWLGDGETVFTCSVFGTDGEEKVFEIHTDEETVGAALLNIGLIAGEDSDYGLYVKTVNGETLDYDTDGKYWAFYIDGEYAVSGVDATAIEAGKTYAFKAE